MRDWLLTPRRFLTALLAASLLALSAPAIAVAFALGLGGHDLFMILVAADKGENSEPDQHRSSQKKLERLRSLMKKEKAELSRVMAQEGNLLEKLEALQIQLKDSGQRMKELQAEIKIVELEAGDLTVRTDQLQGRADQLKRVMNRRLRARYRFGRLGYSKVLFEAEDLADLSRRMAYLDATFRADRARLDEERGLLAEWGRARELLSSRHELLADFKTALEEQRSMMAEEKKTLEKMLEEIREEQQKHETMLAELRTSARKLEGVIAGLDRSHRKKNPVEEPEDAESASGFGSRRGRLCYPASGPVLVRFGKRVHPRFNTETMHNGVEIGAKPGAPVKTVDQGVVRFASWFQGYGNLVIVDHGDGYYTVYAHLAEIRAGVGQEVAAGQTIGTVGDTGSIEGPSLYFEIRHHQRPLNPEAWLSGCSL